MIDIVFSDSACGSLKMAQHYGKGKYQGGCMGISISHDDGSEPTKEEVETARREAEKKARLAWESATPMGGKTSHFQYLYRAAYLVGRSFRQRTRLCEPC